MGNVSASEAFDLFKSRRRRSSHGIRDNLPTPCLHCTVV
jgi:hypothetical protein